MHKAKRKKCLILALLLALCSSLTAYAGTWQQVSGKWEYITDLGTKETGIFEVGGKTYLADSGGTMLTGWQQVDGRWYFLDTRQGADEGSMKTGWQWIDGRCYYLSPTADATHPKGCMYAGETTPDGYTVSETGAWTENGKEVVINGKGIITKPVAAAAARYISGGGSGGGSGSGGSQRGSSASESSGSSSEKKKPVIEDEIIGGDEFPEDDEAETPDPPKSKVKPESSESEDEEVSIASPSNAESKEDIEDDTDDEEPELKPFTIMLKAALMSSPPEEGEIPDYECEFYIHFTDEETHSEVLANTRHGFLRSGDSISIGYAQTITDEDGNIWHSTTEPRVETIYSEGVSTIYIEYVLTGHRPEDPDPFEEERELLKEWIETAKEADTLITGEDIASIPDSRVLLSSQAQANQRLRSIAAAISDTQIHQVYIIGKNITPNGIALKEYYGENITYGSDTMEEITIEDDAYTVERFSIQKSYDKDTCSHEWEETVTKAATCLERGISRYRCSLCDKSETVYKAALGHIDEDGDSVCDRCLERTFVKEVGSQISAVLSTGGTDYDLTLTLADQNYQNGCLYISETVIPISVLGGFGNNAYEDTGCFAYFGGSFGNDFSINGDNLLPITIDGLTAYAGLLSESEAAVYMDIIGGEYVTSTKGLSGLVQLFDTGSKTEIDPTEDFGARIAVILKSPEEGEGENAHWNIGDAITRTIDGEEYIFRCIDTNYSDKLENHTVAALFMCDTIIPAGYGGEYRTEIDGTGHEQEVWHSGPIATFGPNNNYKYSNIRAFLDAETVFNAADIQIGVDNSYTGSTTKDKFSETSDAGLKTYSIGYQKMNARLFILSVDEAIKYRSYLWKFNGSSEDNPDTVTDATSLSYWLRNPSGTSTDYPNTELAYVVDLVDGNIHPENIKPATVTGDPFIDSQTTVGIRPVFSLPQQ